MNQSIFRLISGVLMYLNPLQKEFSRKEAVVYYSRREGPTGLWEKLPKLHYCLFNRGKEHLLKTDVELQAAKVNPSKKAIILITDDATGQAAGLDLKEWVTTLRADWNVVVIHLHETPRNVPMWKDVMTVGPLVRGDLPQVVRQEVQDLSECTEVDAVIALSLETGGVLKPLREEGLPILLMIPEFLHTPRQLARLKKSRRDATLQLFPGESSRKRAAEVMAITPDQRMVVLADVSSVELTVNISDLIKTAAALIKEEEQQIEDLLSSGVFLKEYSIPDIADDRVAVGAYLAAWRSGWKPRKPCPGFHPGVYRDHHPESAGDPTIDFLKEGKPEGLWLTEVMGDAELKDKSGKVGKKHPRVRAALHLHFHYTDGIEGLLRKIRASRLKPDLFVSTTNEEGKRAVQELLAKNGMTCCELAVFPNRGRDIGPFLTGYGARLFKDYDIVGHLHSKKSPHAHDDYLQNWVEFLEKGLIGKSGGMMDAILDKMASDPSIGIVYPDDPGCFGWEGNYSYGKALIERMGYKAPLPDASINFPVGTMFWARSEALKPLLNLNLQWEDYPEEPLPIDGSMLHAIERLFGIIPEQIGYRTMLTHVPGLRR